ncbi:MAG: hypothetical protein JWO37_899 [Acidimicrobiales bacterium]|nr:hypothetical protein [Acidimicrobiales bacterium]
MTRISIGGAVALVLAGSLAGCTSSSHRQSPPAASVVPPDAIAFVSYAVDPPESQRGALTTALTPKGGHRPTWADGRAQLLAGFGRRFGIDVSKTVVPWATEEIAIAVLPDRTAVLIAKAGSKPRAEAALKGTNLVHYLIKDHEVIAKAGKTLDQLVTTGATLAETDRYRRAVAAAPAVRLGVGLVDTNACRTKSASHLDFSVRAGRGALVVEGIAGGAMTDVTPGQPSATDSLPVDTLASLTTFDGRTINDVADAALGCVPSVASTPSTSAVLSAGFPTGIPTNFGINVDRDIVPWLRGESVFALGPPRSPIAVADVGLVARPVDSPRAAGALPRIEDALALYGQFQWSERDQGGVHFLSVPQPIAGVPGLQPAVGIVNGRVVLASSPDYFVALAKPKPPTLGSGAAYQSDIDRPVGQTVARAVFHLAALRDLFGGRLPVLATISDPLIARADTVVFTLARDNAVNRFRLLIRYGS